MRRRRTTRTVAGPWTVIMSALLLAVACGGPDGAETGQLGSEEQPADGAGPADVTTTVAAADDGPTTTVGAGADLPADHPGTPLVETIIAIHGPTDDVSATANRLAYFPPFPSAPGAHITDIGLTSSTALARLTYSLGFVADGDAPTLQQFFDVELASLGWEKAGVTEGTAVSGASEVKLDYEHDTEGRVTIRLTDDPGYPKMHVSATYSLAVDRPIEPSGVAERFGRWHADLPVPEGWESLELNLITRFAEGRTDIDLETTYRYPPDRFADTQRETVFADMTGLAEAGAVDAEVDESYFEMRVPSRLAAEPVTIKPTDVNGEWAEVRVFGGLPFNTPGFSEPRAEAPADESADPIVGQPTAAEIASVVAEMHGPTADVTAQMRRLGPFPDLPTPNGAQVVGVAVEVDESFDVTEREIIREMAVDVSGAFEELSDFYEAQMVALGHTLAERTDDTVADVPVRTLGFNIDGVDDNDRTPMRIIIEDDPDRADVRVRFVYALTVPAAEAELDRWSAWPGSNPPIPPDGELLATRVASSVDGRAGRITYEVEYGYAGLDNAQVIELVDGAVPGSDYRPADTSSPFSDLTLTHPEYTEVRVSTALFGRGGAVLVFAADRDLDLG